MFLYIYFVIALHFAIATDSEESNYTISMVSSIDNRGSPAVFAHAESPVWDQETNSLYFVDVHSQNVHRLDYTTGNIYTKHIEYGQVNVVSLVCHSSRLIVAVRSALYLLEWEVAGDAALRLLTTVDHGLPDNVINEAKPDAAGRYWAGSKGPHVGDEVTPDRATLYSVSQERLEPRVHIRPVSISNGLAWSLNNSVFYYVDSPTHKVEAFDFKLTTGEISGRRTIIDIRDYGYDDAIPDGMTIDSEGHLWVALMFGGTVLHIDPEARSVVFSYKLPVAEVTSVAWGGRRLDELFVTTSRGGRAELGGALYTIRHTGATGVPPHCFKYHAADQY